MHTCPLKILNNHLGNLVQHTRANGGSVGAKEVFVSLLGTPAVAVAGGPVPSFAVHFLHLRGGFICFYFPRKLIQFIKKRTRTLLHCALSSPEGRICLF